MTSLSKKVKRLPEIVIDRGGKVHAGSASPLHMAKAEDSICIDQLSCPRCPELEEAPHKTQTLPTAEQLAENRNKIKASKENYEEIKFAMEQSIDSIYIIYDSTKRTFVRAEPDTDDLI